MSDFFTAVLLQVRLKPDATSNPALFSDMRIPQPMKGVDEPARRELLIL
jgi:hypothetical protein